MSLQETAQLLGEFKTLVNQSHPPIERANELLSKLKLALIKFSFPDTKWNPEEEKQHLLICREILENSAFYSIKTNDVASFERFLAQLKAYYYDFADKLPTSAQQYTLLGLNLLRLLAKNKLDEFHTELELIPLDKQIQSVFIKHPVQLEQYMMEGAYNKVLKASNEIPSDYYKFFMGILMETVRDEIADCLTASYNTISLLEAQKILALTSLDLTRQYANKKEWKIENNVIQFKQDTEAEKAEIPTLRLIKQTLHYARELERIV